MVCPICISTAIVANAPLISASLVGSGMAALKFKQIHRLKNKSKYVIINQTKQNKTSRISELINPPIVHPDEFHCHEEDNVHGEVSDEEIYVHDQ